MKKVISTAAVAALMVGGVFGAGAASAEPDASQPIRHNDSYLVPTPGAPTLVPAKAGLQSGKKDLESKELNAVNLPTYQQSLRAVAPMVKAVQEDAKKDPKLVLELHKTVLQDENLAKGKVGGQDGKNLSSSDPAVVLATLNGLKCDSGSKSVAEKIGSIGANGKITAKLCVVKTDLDYAVKNKDQAAKVPTDVVKSVIAAYGDTNSANSNRNPQGVPSKESEQRGNNTNESDAAKSAERDQYTVQVPESFSKERFSKAWSEQMKTAIVADAGVRKAVVEKYGLDIKKTQESFDGALKAKLDPKNMDPATFKSLKETVKTATSVQQYADSAAGRYSANYATALNQLTQNQAKNVDKASATLKDPASAQFWISQDGKIIMPAYDPNFGLPPAPTK